MAPETTSLQVGLDLPSFIRFVPSDEDLVAGFLSKKLGGGADYAGGDLQSWGDHWAAFSEGFVPTVDLYGEDAYPWRVCQQLAYPYGLGSTEFYCFTPRRKKSDGGCWSDRTVGSSGTWLSNGSSDHKIYHGGVLVGRRANLSFQMLPPPGSRKTGGGGRRQSKTKKEMVTTHWVMHEYRLERPGFQEMVLCRVRNLQKERDQEKNKWEAPWWEEQQPAPLQEVLAVNGGDGGEISSCSRRGGAQKKRKVAPALCSEVEVSAPPQQQRRLEMVINAAPPVQIMPQQQQPDHVLPADPPALLSPSAATSPPFSSGTSTITTAASAPNDDLGFLPQISTGGGFGDQHDQLLQEAMDYYSQQEDVLPAPPALLMSPSAAATPPFSSTTAASSPNVDVQVQGWPLISCSTGGGGFGGADQHDQLFLQKAMDDYYSQPDVPAPPALLMSPSAAATPGPFSSSSTTTAASSPNDVDQVQGWPLISCSTGGGGFGGADEHDQLFLQKAMDYLYSEEEAASGADSVLPDQDLQEQRVVDEYLSCISGATDPLIITSVAEVDVAALVPADQPAAAGGTAAGLISSSSTGAGAVDGTAGWTSDQQLLYWHEIPDELLPSCTSWVDDGAQQLVEEEEEEEAGFRLWDW